MSDSLLKTQMSYLAEVYAHLPEGFEQCLPAKREDDVFHFRAFGEPCSISPRGITLGDRKISDAIGILIAIYACHARKETVQLRPLKSFKQMKGSMPYQGAFTIHSEKSLAPYVSQIERDQEKVMAAFDGHVNEEGKGDFSFTLYPLPKVPLYYNFYLADDEFPASVTCLFAANAELFMPMDGLADVGEYTAKKIIEMLTL